MSRKFSFNLFRINIVDADDMFSVNIDQRLRGDPDLINVFKNSTSSEMDQRQETRSAIFKWSLRQYIDLTDLGDGRQLIHLVLARSLLEKDGLIVTDDGISSGTSSSYPPLASAAVVLVDLSRHLVAVEHTGDLSQTAWKDFIEKILNTTSLSLEKLSYISLEPVPERNGIIGLFLSFDKVTRMKITLRIPNPELNRYTRDLYDDLVRSELREITQDMKNPNGMSKAVDARPYACAVLAEQGYKAGDVSISGLKDGEYEEATSGSDAVRGNLKGLRDFIRGLSSNLKTKEAKQAVKSIFAEIDKIHPEIDTHESSS